MPLAEGTAEEALDELEDPRQLIELITAICDGLRAPHRDGWVHRDLKPANVLRLGGAWAVADWGLGRRPRGQTSHPGRTHVGAFYGTEGFAPPELSDDAHQVGPQADIYSLGQIIGWALTRTLPRANRPLLPPDMRWRKVVEAMTRDSPAQRPASVDEVLGLVNETDTETVRPRAVSVPRQTAARELVAASDPNRQITVPAPIDPAPASTPRDEPIIVKGILGRIEFDGRTVTIVKDGYGPQMKGQYTVMLREIRAITLKAATRWNHGYLQLVVRDQRPAPVLNGVFLGGRPHMQDPLSMSFRYRTNADASRIKRAIEAALELL